MQETLQIIVTGAVQGVYFRQSAKEKAMSLDIKGTVRNTPDGSVIIVASGEHNDLQLLIEWCYVGPLRAEVADVHVEKVSYMTFNDFKIIRG